MKSKTTAAVLALLLGGLGVHKFYLGRPGQGFLYLLFCWSLVPAFIALIDFFFLVFMSQEKFNKKYLTTTEQYQMASPQTHVKCPDCRELVRKDARKCRHCGCTLEPEVA